MQASYLYNFLSTVIPRKELAPRLNTSVILLFDFFKNVAREVFYYDYLPILHLYFIVNLYVTVSFIPLEGLL